MFTLCIHQNSHTGTRVLNFNQNVTLHRSRTGRHLLVTAEGLYMGVMLTKQNWCWRLLRKKHLLLETWGKAKQQVKSSGHRWVTSTLMHLFQVIHLKYVFSRKWTYDVCNALPIDLQEKAKNIELKNLSPCDAWHMLVLYLIVFYFLQEICFNLQLCWMRAALIRAH